jgi:hypothetical protein
MKKLILLALFFGMASVALGEVSTRVCEADGNTPFDGRNIMVGTKVTIIVSSDSGGYWSGALTIEGTNLNYGALSARDYNENTYDWEGSRFDAAGTEARVYTYEEAGKYGFQLLGDSSAVAGDWFIIDYNGVSVGDCNVGFYDHSVSWYEPIYYLPFSHIRTRDFNNDTVVDFADFALFGSYWQAADCNDSNWCEGTDLDTSGNVDANDLALFVDYWLERTE